MPQFDVRALQFKSIDWDLQFWKKTEPIGVRDWRVYINDDGLQAYTLLEIQEWGTFYADFVVPLHASRNEQEKLFHDAIDDLEVVQRLPKSIYEASSKLKRSKILGSSSGARPTMIIYDDLEDAVSR